MKRHSKLVLLLVVLSLVLGVSFAYAKPEPKSRESRSKMWSKGPTKAVPVEYKEGELLVKFKRGVRPKTVSIAHTGVGSKVLRRFARSGIDRVELKAGLTIKEAISLYRKDPNVEYAEPNYKLHICDLFPSDPGFSNLWGLHNTGQSEGTPDADIDAPETWTLSTGAGDVIVGVIDTGVDYNHEDLNQNMWRNPDELYGTPGTDDDGNGYIDDLYGIDACNDDSNPMDDYGHGTHCAGTIGAVGNNGIGVVGVNWNVKIMALKFISADGYGWTDDAIECLEYAIMMKQRGHNIRVTSNSWGGGEFSQALYNAVQAAQDANILFVAAAGNETSDNDVYPAYPASYDLPNVLAVAATDRNDQLAYFSNWGATSVDVAAPGVDILSTVPGNGYQYYSGTSMATPHVSGLAALLLSLDDSCGTAKVKETIINNVDPLPNLNGIVLSGGRINAQKVLSNAIVCTSTGVIALDRDGYRPPAVAQIRLSDCDLNVDPNAKDVLEVVIASGNEQETVTLIEVGANAGTFTGSIEMAFSDAAGVLWVSETDTVTVSYEDQSPFGTRTASAIVDTVPPVITNVRAIPHPDGARADIEWDTLGDNSNSSVNFGTAASQLDRTASDRDLVTHHSITLQGLMLGTTYYFDCQSADAAGNMARDDNGGSHYQFTTPCPAFISTSPGAIFIDSSWYGEIMERQLLIHNYGCESLTFSITEDIPWLTAIDPAAGSVPPHDGVQAITIIIDTGLLGRGTYEGALTINSNDPGEPSFIVPVTLRLGYPFAVSPPSGPGGTSIHIFGDAFEPGAKVALYGGGPNKVGSVRLPDFPCDVFVSGNYAYVADDYAGLVILDVSDPSCPKVAGSCDTPGEAAHVHVKGDYAYLADWREGLQVIDVSNPACPRIVGNALPFASRVYVSGEYAYVIGSYPHASATSYLMIMDINDPTAPILLGMCPTYGDDICVQGGYAYVALGDGLKVIDVSDPAHPTQVGYSEEAVGSALYLSGNYAYLAGRGITVVDTSEPERPSVIGSCTTPGSSNWKDLWVSGDYAYFADGWGGIQAISISDPSHPVLHGTANPQSRVPFNDYYTVHGSGDYAYVAGYEIIDPFIPIYEYYLAAIDVRQSANPSLLGSCPVVGPADPLDYGYYRVTTSENYACMTQNGNAWGTQGWQLSVIDISDPRCTSVKGTVWDYGHAVDSFASGKFVYAATTAGLTIIDINDPTHPSITGTYDTPNVARAVQVSGNNAYVTDDHAGLLVLDISSPSQPLLVASCAEAKGDYIYVSGDYAYVAEPYYQVLRIVDIHDPSHPVLLGQTTIDFWTSRLYVSGNYAYATCWSGVQVINVSNRSNPAHVGWCGTPGPAEGVFVSGNYAYVATSNFGIQVLDVSDPAHPFIAGACDTPGWASDVCVYGGNVFVADSGHSTAPDQEGAFLQVLNGFVPCTNVQSLGTTEIEASVPIELAPGTYDIHVADSSQKIVTGHNTFSIVLSSSQIVSIAATDGTASESGDPGSFTVTRTGDTSSSLTVNYTVSGTAANATDYAALPGTVTIPAGSSSAVISIVPANDGLSEPTETVTVTLSPGCTHGIGAPSAATVLIRDNDAQVVTVSAAKAVAWEPSNPGQFTVMRTGDLDFPLTVSYSITGTAAGGVDYAALSGSATIPAGSSSVDVNIEPIDDSISEATETVILTLAGGSYAIGSPSSATVTIADDDTQVVTVTAPFPNTAELSPGAGEFLITRTGDLDFELYVNFSLTGTATKGGDYYVVYYKSGDGDDWIFSESESVLIPARSSCVTAKIVPIDDALFEGSETVILTLLGGASYNVGTSDKATVIIADDEPTSGPTVSSLTPAQCYPGQEITIKGSNFGSTQGTGTVTIGEEVLTEYYEVTYWSNTQIKAVVPPHICSAFGTGGSLAENVHVTVNSIASNTKPLTVLKPTVCPPEITYFDPGQCYPEQEVTINGDHFGNTPVNGSYVTIGAFSYWPGDPTILSWSNNQIRVKLPSYACSRFGDNSSITTVISVTVDWTDSNLAFLTILRPPNCTPTAPTVTIAATDADAAEPGTNTGAFRVSRTGDTTSALAVNYSVTGTAANGTDYNTLSGSVTIPAGSSSVDIPVTPLDDTAVEGSETVVATLSSSPSYVVGTPGSATVTISDNDAPALPTVTITVHDSFVSEPGTDTGSFRVSRSGETGSALIVHYSVGGTATTSTDYAALTGTVTIAAGSSSEYVLVAPVDDGILEGGETVAVTLSSNPAYTIGTPGAASLTIQDDEHLPEVTVSATDGTASEPGTDTGTFTVYRTGSTSAALTVCYTMSGTATNGTDYGTLSGSVTIPAGSSSTNIALMPVDDIVYEGTETAAILLVADPSYILGPIGCVEDCYIEAMITVADNDKPVMTIAASDPNASEPGPDAGTFTISRTGTYLPSLTVNCAVSGTATNGTDYTSLSGSVTMPYGLPSVTITVSPLDDALVEGDESVMVTLSSSASYDIGTPASATVTIADDDVMPVVTITATDADASEAGSNAGQFTVARTGSTSSALTVSYAISGTATNGTDYSVLSGSVTIGIGSSSALITVTPVNDTVYEGNETVILTLSGSASYEVGTPSSSTLTIADDDKPEISIWATDSAASEQNIDPGTLVISRTGITILDLMVYYTLSGTAAKGGDYGAAPDLTGSIVIPAGSSSVSVVVTPLEDALCEGTETVIVTLKSDPSYNLAPCYEDCPIEAMITIVDNDKPELTITASDSDASEPGTNTGTLTISRTGTYLPSLTANYTVGGTATSGSDYTALSGSITIPYGSTSATIAISPIDDGLVEGNETVTVTLSSSASYNIGSPGSATVTIADDDVPPTVTITATDASASETGPNTGQFTLTRTGSTLSALTVSYTVSGTATNGTDYTSLSGSVTIGAGSSSATITVTPVNDTSYEVDESVTVALSSNASYLVGTPGSGTVTIADNDLPEVTVYATDATASEPGTNTGTFTVNRSGITTSALTVYYNVSGTATSGSDYTAIGGSVTIPPGSSSQTISVVPIDDTLMENTETVIVTLTSNPSYILGPIDCVEDCYIEATITIADDDKPTVTIAATDANAAEPGTDTGQFTITRTGSTASALTVNYAVSGSATNGTDYTSLSGSVTIPTGSSSASIIVSPIDDSLVEGSETVGVTLSTNASYTVGSPSGATVTIADNDTAALPTVAVTAYDATAAEPGSNTGKFKVTRTGSTGSSLTVYYTLGGTATNGTDYNSLSGLVTISAGYSYAYITVTPKDDTLIESGEAVILTLSAKPAYNIGSLDSATVTILDNEMASISGFNVSQASPGSQIAIMGCKFGATKGTSTVTFGSKVLTGSPDIVVWSDTSIIVRVPTFPCDDFAGSTYAYKDVYVTVGGNNSNSKPFKVLKPAGCP